MVNRRLQFGILTLLALTALVAVALWATEGGPSAVKDYVLFALVPGFVGLSLVGCCSTGGYGRAFFLGTLAASSFACLAFLFFWAAPYGNLYGNVSTASYADIQAYREIDWLSVTILVKRLLRTLWSLVIPIGLMCVAFHWLLIRGSGNANARGCHRATA